jgi:2'-5' RNA ligase
LRLFFALWPDEDIAQRLAAAASLFKIEGRGRLVSPRNYHMTLAFVGEVADARLAVLQQIGQSMRSGRFTVVCNSLEFWAAPCAIVAAAQETPPVLLDLSARLHDAIDLPRAALRAHVTLARKAAQASVLPVMSPIAWRATQFSLIRSDTGGAESAYTVVDTWQLLDKS